MQLLATSLLYAVSLLTNARVLTRSTPRVRDGCVAATSNLANLDSLCILFVVYGDVMSVKRSSYVQGWKVSCKRTTHGDVPDSFRKDEVQEICPVVQHL
jgi:hypothetical protein